MRSCQGDSVTELTVRAIESNDVDRCRLLLESLPEWFGLAESNAAYVQALHELPGILAVDGDDAVVGFLAIRNHTPESAEIEVMAVDRSRHRGGVGRLLIDRAVEWCGDQRVRWLHVKTRGPSTYDDDYEQTRRFYRAVGFEPLYESLTEWGREDAALIMVMTVAAR